MIIPPANEARAKRAALRETARRPPGERAPRSPGAGARPAPRRRRLREDRLLERQERPPLHRGRGEGAKEGGGKRAFDRPREGKDEPGGEHEEAGDRGEPAAPGPA